MPTITHPTASAKMLLRHFEPNEERLRNLLEAGADPNEQVRNSYPLLIACIDAGYSEGAIALLLAHGAEPNAMAGPLLADEHREGQTALARAACKARTEDRFGIVKALIDAAADINLLDTGGKTALDHALSAYDRLRLRYRWDWSMVEWRICACLNEYLSLAGPQLDIVNLLREKGGESATLDRVALQQRLNRESVYRNQCKAWLCKYGIRPAVRDDTIVLH